MMNDIRETLPVSTAADTTSPCNLTTTIITTSVTAADTPLAATPSAAHPKSLPLLNIDAADKDGVCSAEGSKKEQTLEEAEEGKHEDKKIAPLVPEVSLLPAVSTITTTITTSTTVSTTENTTVQNSTAAKLEAVVERKQGLQPLLNKSQPQLVTLNSAVYTPAEFNSFNRPVTPQKDKGEFDLLTPASIHTPASSMIFSELYRSRKNGLYKTGSNQSSESGPDGSWDPDLLSKDKAKQREAIKRHLEQNVRVDWKFEWTRTDVPPLPIVERRIIVDGEERVIRYHDPEAEANDEGIPHATLNNQEGRRVIETSLPNTAPLKDIITQQVASTAAENPTAADTSDDESIYSLVTDDPTRFKVRLNWDSDIAAMAAQSDKTPKAKKSTDSKSVDSWMATMKAKARAKRERRNIAQEEMKWNEGLACFEARRNQWTCAKMARLKPAGLAEATAGAGESGQSTRGQTQAQTQTSNPLNPLSPLSPLSPKRFWARYSTSYTATTNPSASPFDPATTTTLTSPSPPNCNLDIFPSPKPLTCLSTTGSASASTTASTSSIYPVETILPLAGPLLPPNNPMRSSIGPKIYLAIYDRTIILSMTPSCPINLADMLPACVAGWKRDGEWPPRGDDGGAEGVGLGIGGRRKSGGEKGLRGELRKVFGLR